MATVQWVNVSSGEITAFTIETEATDWDEGWKDDDDEHLITIQRTVWWNEKDGTSGLENDHFNIEGLAVGVIRNADWM